MLVDFTAKNFRSIREEQTLSFYAQKNVDHFSNAIHFPSSEKLGVLASAGIYGANASGKTNILKALNIFFEFVNQSHLLSEGDAIGAYQPYRLASACMSSPSFFALEFIVDGVRYIYEIEFDSQRVISESLDFYSKGSSREVRSKLFHRAKDAPWENITFGTYFKGGTRKIPVFVNQAYLSKAGNSPDAPLMIRQVYQFFKRGVVFAPDNPVFSLSSRKDEKLISNVAKFLSEIDTGISGVIIKKENREDFIPFLEDMPEQFKNKVADELSSAPYFQHDAEDGEKVLFPEYEESDGTRALFHILPLLIKVFNEGLVLVWDELESSLHPHVSELIVNLFNDPVANKSHAQLLFTTHNIDLMDSSKMRKDQLWLTEKHKGETHLFSLDEFDAGLKPTSPFAKWYDEGRLGGLPAIDINKVQMIFSNLGQDGKKDAKKT